MADDLDPPRADDLTPPWPAMDAAARTQAYSPSTMVGGNIAPFIQAYVDQSAAAYAAFPNMQTLFYSDRTSQSIDLIVPESETPVACHVFIHGGYWQQLSKTDSFFPAPDTMARGIAFAAVGYTLAPHASLDEIVAEVIAALRHLHANAETLGIDPTRIIVSGSSAGAQLAAMAGVILKGPEKPAGLILLSGIYDLRPLLNIYVNDALGMDEEDAKRNSPLMRGISDFPPAVFAWGEFETNEFKRQRRHFSFQLEYSERETITLEVAGRNHFDIVHDLANDTPLGWHLTRMAGM